MTTKLAHQLTANCKLLQKAIIIHNDKFLLLKRQSNAATRPNCWDLPGGNSEWPDQLTEFTRGLHRQDLVREITEETGIVIDPEAVFQRDLVHFDTTFEPEKNIFGIICGWRQNLNGTKPEITLSSEHTEFVWTTPDQLDQYDFGYADFIPKMVRLAFQ